MIRARCHPKLEAILPAPRTATVPDWFRAMPADVAAPSLGGEVVRTLKHCPPVIDAMTSGILIPLAADLVIAGGEVSWDWDPPVLEDALISRAPVGLHVPEQATGAPFRMAAGVVLKFMNFWTLSVPEGVSLLFTHPLNREDLPFRTLSGVVDCDRFGDGFVHFPALWTDADFEGVLPAGTPVAQVFALPRAGQDLDIGPMSPDEVARNRAMQTALQSDRGHYRKTVRH